MSSVNDHKNNHDENGKWITAALVPYSGLLVRLLYLRDGDRGEKKRKSQRTERLGMGNIKGGNYVIVQFISIRLCQELHNNSSG